MWRFGPILVLVSNIALADPPPGVALDPMLHEWFEHQRNLRGGWCCDLGDGHILSDDEWRIVGSDYQVRINDKWYSVPSHALRDATAGGPNPTGHPIAWYRIPAVIDGMAPIIYCFAPGWTG